MMGSDKQELSKRVGAALKEVSNSRTGEDVLTSQQVQRVDVGADGTVSVQMGLHPEDSSELVREVRAALKQVEGVSRVRVDVKLPEAAMARAPTCGGGGQQQEGAAPQPDPEMLPGVAHVVAVSSGKGGVGKSTVATNLAVALGMTGQRVGLIDADVYGPNIPRMFGEKRRPRTTGEPGDQKIMPLEAHGIKLMSLGLLLEDDQPAIMRGPLITGILRQFLDQVDWQELDVLLVDMPPGTGDAQLSLVQTVHVDGVIMVTTPQDVATGDVRRAVRMFERVDTRVLGIIENMSGFCCPRCNESVDVFGVDGGRKLAEDMGLPLLGKIPLEPAVVRSSDEGKPLVMSDTGSPASGAFKEAAERLMELLAVPPDA